MSLDGQSEPLVDLGDDFEPAAGIEWRFPARTWTWVLRIGVPLLLIVALAGASAPDRAPLRRIADVPSGLYASVLRHGDDLYTYDVSGGDNRISDYDLRDGKLRWQAVTGEIASETTMTYLGGRVLVSMADTDVGGEHTVAFDAASGRKLWTDELGYATVVSGGILVEAAPRPPGYNFPGTATTTAYRLLDPAGGAVRWTVTVPVGCVTAVSVTENTLLELCSVPAALTEVDLADGRTTRTRPVALGDPADNFTLPPADQLGVPYLDVVGDTALVGHANAPTPTVDAYAIGDLSVRWQGLPVSNSDGLEGCGDALCVVTGTDNALAVSLATGRAIGPAPSEAAPPSRYSLRVVGAPAPKPVPNAPGGWVSAALPAPRSPAPTLLSFRGDPAALLHGSDQSCLDLAGYLACATANSRIDVWSPRA